MQILEISYADTNVVTHETLKPYTLQHREFYYIWPNRRLVRAVAFQPYSTNSQRGICPQMVD